MSSEKRKAQRRYVKNQLLKEKGNTDGFKEAWEDYRRKEKKNEDGSVTVVHRHKRRKKHHYDDGKIFLSHLRTFKQMIQNRKNEAKKNKKVEE